MTRVVLSAMLASVVALAACGGDDTTESAEGPTAPPSAELRRCLRSAGLELRRTPPATGVDRIPTTLVPADHLGVVVFDNRSYADVWLARDRRDAQRTAELLNAEYSRKGGGQVEATVLGLGVVALAGGYVVPEREEAAAVDRCLSRVSRARR